MKKKMNKKAFTLIELIVVIAIIWFLWVVWVMTFMQWFGKWRDASRVAALQNMSMALETSMATHTTYPLPDNYVEIKYSGDVIWYQWKFGKDTVSSLSSIKKAPKDPKDNTYYTYTLSADKKHYELMALMENGTQKVAYMPGIVDEVYADDKTDRKPKTDWSALWVLLDENNNPIEEVTTTAVDLWSGKNYGNTVLKIVYNDKDTVTGTWKLLWWVLASNMRYPAPSSCPEGFIAVPGNPNFPYAGGTVKWFCVAKYEMSCDGLPRHKDHKGNDDWDTQSWYYQSWSCNLVSKPWNYPLADIKEWEAIDACKSIWGHLITNNERMTIARNIEQVASNRSSEKVWEWYIRNGRSNDETLWCNGTWDDSKRAELAGTACSEKQADGETPRNELSLTNGQKIWDFVGNVWEEVNKANTIDGSDYDNWHTSVWWSSKDDGWDDDGIYSWSDMLKYGSVFWLWKWAWMWNVYYAKWKDNDILGYGASANNGINAGVFALAFSRTGSNAGRVAGFRCVISK